MSGTLYLVGTPIGNLGDLSVRALETLRSVDFIAAEDTRVTAKLLNHFEIKKPCVSYYEHNKYASGEKIVARLLAGETCALVTDAGMPAISDPGEDIVRQCAEQGIDVQVIPGPCAAIAALAVSGLPTQQFCFEGFLAVSGKTRREHLQRLQGETRTMIFYEAPHKLCATLRDLAALCDIFYIGGTKCGALLGEAVVIPQPGLIPHFFTIIKQHGALLAKGRLLGIQFDTLFTDGLYERIGADAVRYADAIRRAMAENGYLPCFPSPTNQSFCIVSEQQRKELAERVDFSVWEQYDETHSIIRFATSWATREEDVNALCRILRECIAQEKVAS